MQLTHGFIASLTLHAFALGGFYGWAVTSPEFLGQAGGGGIEVSFEGAGDAPAIQKLLEPQVAPEKASAKASTKTSTVESEKQGKVPPLLTKTAPAARKLERVIPNKQEERPEISLSAKKVASDAALPDANTPSAEGALEQEAPRAAFGGSTGVLGGGGGLAGGLGSGPEIIKSPKPDYPALARRANFEGRVVLDIIIDTDGTVSRAEVVTTSGRSDCDESARDTILARWRFKPARVNGMRVAWQERVAVSYELK